MNLSFNSPLRRVCTVVNFESTSVLLCRTHDTTLVKVRAVGLRSPTSRRESMTGTMGLDDFFSSSRLDALRYPEHE